MVTVTLIIAKTAQQPVLSLYDGDIDNGDANGNGSGIGNGIANNNIYHHWCCYCHYPHATLLIATMLALTVLTITGIVVIAIAVMSR